MHGSVTRIAAGSEELEGLKSGFTDGNPTPGMYDFEIGILGWYNIDGDVEGYEETIIARVISFNKINNGIPLFRGERAILFAFGSEDDKIIVAFVSLLCHLY